MNLVDSCGWLEYFADDENADFFAPAIENTKQLLVPTISILEVYKRVLQQRSENEAIYAITLMQQGNVVDLDVYLSISAAKLGFELKLPLVDSIILATAYANEAIVWTQDNDFEGINGVNFRPKIKKSH